MSLDLREAHLAAETQHTADLVVAALDDVGRRLAAPDLFPKQRLALLQRQAELGDLRDELALRERRRAAQRLPRR